MVDKEGKQGVEEETPIAVGLDEIAVERTANDANGNGVLDQEVGHGCIGA